MSNEKHTCCGKCHGHSNPVQPKPHKLLDIIKESPTEWTFRVENDLPIRDGQFMQVSLPKVGECPISISGYGEGYCDFTIRSVGKVTDALFELQPGDTIFLRGCYGNGWPVEQYKGKNMVVIAGGTGVSPVKSLIDKFYQHPEEYGEVYIILGFKNEESILFRETLDNWQKAPNIHPIYTLDNEDKEGWEKGLVTAFIDRIPFKDFDGNYECVVVGPPIMMKFVNLELLKFGVPEDKIWVSYERKMSCGIGKCGHCRIDDTYVCVDGPIFNYSFAKNLID